MARPQVADGGNGLELWRVAGSHGEPTKGDSPSILYECETCLIFRKEYNLKAFENRMLRRILGPKREDVTAGRRKLHNEELRSLCSSVSIVRMIKSRIIR
jgi:hypothetical protein